MSEQSIILVRHAQTEWSASGQHTGLTDMPLTEKGREDSLQLRPRLAGLQDRVVFSSPLIRATETMELAGFGGAPQLRPDLVEWDYGDYEGLTTEQIQQQAPQWDLWSDGVPGGESPADVAARVDRVVVELVALEKDAIVFAHGHLLRAFAARWACLDIQAGRALALGAGAVCELGWHREVRVIQGWNDTGGR